MTVNNFDIIRPMLTFENEGDCYYLQIIQRKKDGGTTKSAHTIRDYYITSIDSFDEKKHEIITMCDIFKARAMIRLNKRNINECNLYLISEIIDRNVKKQTVIAPRLYASVMGSHHCDKHKKWIIDVDDVTSDASIIAQYITFINNNCEPCGDKIICLIPSSTGIHIITTPFNLCTFSKQYPLIDIHKDTPTNLYIS